MSKALDNKDKLNNPQGADRYLWLVQGLTMLPYDKALHFIYGAIIFCVGYLCSFLWFPEPLWASMALVALFAIGKEAMDKYSNLKSIKAGKTPTHGVEFMDVIATIGGGVSAAFPLFISTYVP